MIPHEDLIRQLARCAATCEMCANACLGEEDVKMMVNCIRLDRDCSRICTATAAFLASGSNHANALVKLCIEMCNECARECSRHEVDHCQECANTCRECASACQDFLDSHS